MGLERNATKVSKLLNQVDAVDLSQFNDHALRLFMGSVHTAYSSEVNPAGYH